MKTKNTKKLTLNKETVRVLNETQLAAANGGITWTITTTSIVIGLTLDTNAETCATYCGSCQPCGGR